MTPNQITLVRVLLAFLSVALFAANRTEHGWSPWAGFVAVALILAAIALDALDGYVARRRNLATPLGAQLDILGDRIIENLFLTYFAVCGLISLWIPVIFFVRGTATDFVRGLAGKAGREAFGRASMLETWWGKALVSSRSSRAAYGVLKCVCFCYLGLQWTLEAARPLAGALAAWMVEISLVGQVLVFLTLAFCVLRGLPVLWEGRRYLHQFGAMNTVGTPTGAASR